MKTIGEHGIVPFDMLVATSTPSRRRSRAPAARGRRRSRTSTSAGLRCCGPPRRTASRSRWCATPRTTPMILAQLKKNAGNLDEETMKELGRKAFALTARYDAAISNYLGAGEGGTDPFPVTFTAQWRRLQALRYGENPHQAAAVLRRHRAARRADAGRRAAAAGEGALLQQHRRHRRGAAARPRVRHPRRGHHQAHESLRRGGLEAPPPRRLQEGARVRPRLRLRRRDRLQPAGERGDGPGGRQHLLRGGHRPLLRQGGAEDPLGQEEPPRPGHGRRVPAVGRPDVRDEAGERRAPPADRATGTCSTRRT